MAIYQYIGINCQHSFEAIQQDPNNPQKICPECNEETLGIAINSSPQVRGPDHFIKGGKDSLIAIDLNKKYKKASCFINSQNKQDARGK